MWIGREKRENSEGYRLNVKMANICFVGGERGRDKEKLAGTCKIQKQIISILFLAEISRLIPS